MANPQVENGFIKIANELWNELLRRDFSKRQLNLILFIWRLSYGTGQKDCKIDSLRTFEVTGIYKQDIRKELEFLKSCAVLDWDEASMVFTINKHYHLWQLTPNKKWDNQTFNRLIHENIKRRNRAKTSTQAPTPTPNTDRKGSEIPTDPDHRVRKTRTFKLVKYEPIQAKKSAAASDVSSVKKVRKPVKNKDIKCNSRDERFQEVMAFYRDNLQRGITESPYNYEVITQCYEEFGFDLLLAAMKLATKAEAKGVKYMETVLFNWKKKGVRTTEDARRLEQQYKAKPHRKQKDQKKKDIVPDWYIEQKEKSRKKKEITRSEEEKKQSAALIDQMLEEYLMSSDG
ncbi:putative prophage replication protein O [Gracilibacillus halophilus YIM-C55.5]|uniref:Putative prophage replication protein O n=1 Tax=Gracilibacillus halophilus YIM-C55.5 TaxID=1308866 RepID=N4WSW0_9BACI|nr:replication protein [Gracilibacillus halophilus]ENH96256.1 putative prophage replication protein O [Gracilibacillus halophilus YIM-C55.5]